MPGSFRVPQRARRFAVLLALLPAGAWAADPQITDLNANPNPVTAGGLYTYAVGIDNSAVEASTNTVLTLTVPSGASFVSAEPASYNCVATSATLVTCTIGALPGNPTGDPTKRKTINLTWRAIAAGGGGIVISGTAAVSSDNDTNLTNNSQSVNTTVNSGADLRLTKTDAPDPVVGGADVTYTLTATNDGPNAAGNLVLTDSLPGSSTFVSASGIGWSCSHAGGLVTCNRTGSLSVGASASPVTVVARVNASGGFITNSATINPAAGATLDPNTDNNTATATTTVLPGADVRIDSKSVSPSAVIADSNATFVIAPRNGGPAPANNVVVTDTLPAGWTFVSATGTGWSCSHAAGTVTCTRATYAVGANNNITLIAKAPNNGVVGPTGSSYVNTATISSTDNDPNPGNNSASTPSFSVLPDGADLRIAKSKSPNPVAQNSLVTSTITITNNGPRVASGKLKIIDQLSGETFESFTGAGWSCTLLGTTTVDCEHLNAGGLAVNASRTVTIVTRATVDGSAVNTACTGSSLPAGAAANGAVASPPGEGDPNPTNDCTSQSTSSTFVQPDLAIAKTTTTPTGGDKTVSGTENSVTYTLVVSNVSTTPQNATGVRITDKVPAWIASGVNASSINSPITATVAGIGSDATFSCSSSGDTVTCNQTGGVLAKDGTVTIPITVNRGMTDGTYTNTANVTNTVQGDPNPNNNSASDTVTIVPMADMQMTGKTIEPSSTKAGQVATYVLSFRNNGPSIAEGVVVTDTFTFPGGDPGFTVTQITSSKPGSSCAVSVGNPNGVAAGDVLNGARNSFTCQIGSMSNNETQTITLKGRPNFQTGNPSRIFTNIADVTTTTAEKADGTNGGNNAQGPVTLNVGPAELDLLLAKTDAGFDPTVYESGKAVLSYRVNVTNNAGSFATGVRITETITPPTGKRVKFVCDTETFGGATCNTTPLCTGAGTTSAPGTALTFTCDLPEGVFANGLARTDLGIGQTKSVFLRFEALDNPEPTGDLFSNQASVTANEPDVLPANNTATEPTTVRRRVELSITKAAKKAGAVVSTVNLREPFVWEMIVNNAGPGDSLQTNVTDTLLSGTEVTGDITWSKTLPAATGTCTRVGLVVTCNMGQLDSGGSITITAPVRLVSYPAGPPLGRQKNDAEVDVTPTITGGIDINKDNNKATAFVDVTRSSISGTVFQDRVRDGANAGTPQAAAQEPRIAGVTLRITGTDLYGNAVDTTTTTDASGDFTFANLSPSDATGYTITQTQPTGFINGTDDPPTSGGAAPSIGGTYARGGTSGNSSYAAIVIDGNTAATRYNFPEIKRPTLSGFVYLDKNANDIRDPATDTGISGATVRLLNGETLITSTTTNASGAYSFTDLDPLVVYTLEQPLPSTPTNLRNGAVNPGQINGAACASGCTAQPNTPVADTDRIASIDLASGADGTVFNFGERQLTSVSGLVYIDKNRNNALDGSDTGRLAGVTVRLVQGASCADGTALQSTTTAANGTYSFTGVLAFQNYLVCETQPVGYGVGNANGTAGSNQITLTNLAAEGSANNNFGALVGRINGSVYQDTGAGTLANFNNGVRDAGEPGIAGVIVTLTGTDALGATVNRTATTDASGDYSFDDLLTAGAGGYTVTEGTIPPAAGTFLDGKTTAGGAGGTATAVNTLPSAISNIALGAGIQTTDYIFGELPNAAISGTVYVDRNRNDTMDPTPTDGRISGVTLTLREGSSCSAGTVRGTTTTAADGTYSFSGVAGGGTYTICETQPTGYADGTVNPGTSGTSSAANSITLTNLPGSGSANNNFGERVGRLSGSVYVDFSAATPANTNNGIRDAGENGIAGVVITLTGNDATGAAVNRSTTTDASGNYSFDDLLTAGAGGYTVTEGAIPPAAGSFNDGKTTAGAAGGTATAVNTLPSAISSIALGAGVQTTNYIFGELPRAGITGTVYVDRNRNDQLDAVPTDGRIAAVTLTLRQGTSCSAGTVLGTTTTDADGQYAFNDVSAGLDYAICETQPTGYADGTVNPGTNGASSAANTIVVTNLPSAGSANNNFGERVGRLSGSVYVDFSPTTPANTNNGIRDAGENGIAGVVITLTGNDATGAAVNRTATTDASGNYSFDDLLTAGAGGYTVTEGAIPPSAGSFNDGKTTAGGAGGTATPVNTLPSAISSITLGAGIQTTNYIFGELPRTSITGVVYVDRNRNDAIDAPPTDNRIAGVTLTLRQGTSCSAGTVLGTTTTDADGQYAFNDVSAGLDYAICETQPTGYANGTVNPGTNGASSAANTIVVTNLPSSGSANNNFGELIGSLTGSVYQDTGAGTAANFDNGVRDAGENGIAGVTITLTGTDATGAAVNRTATTDASGDYRFDDLLEAGAGGYTVTEGTIPPAAGTFLDGKTTAGGAGGTATPVNTLPSAISNIALGAGVQTTDYIFGELPSASVSGTVYVDRNRNDTMDATPTDDRIAGVTLTLRSGTSCSAGTVLGTTTTAADGTYSFSGIAGGGTYTICETQPTGYANGTVNPGTNGASNAANAITLTNLPTTGSTNNNFGERVGSLTGSVYQDTGAGTAANFNNGVRDAGEPGIAGVAVTLTGTDAAGGAVNRTATTDASGDYRFDDLLEAGAGGYTVTEGTIPPAAGTFLDGKTTAGGAGGTATAVNTLPSAISNIALGAGVQTTNYIFGELPSASISGTVYVDRNRNDTLDPTPTDARIAGVTLSLREGSSCSAGTVLGTTTTAADGTYSFSGIAGGGTYTICETQPTGYANGTVNPGTNGASNAANAITLTNLPTTGSTGNNFGERIGSLAGSVYMDTNNDGQKQAGEPGLPGVTVTLTGSDATGTAVNRTATTDAAGAYRFDDLLAAGSGGYTVTEQATQPTFEGKVTINGRTTAGSTGGTATAVTTLPSAISAIPLAAGVDATANNFGELLSVGLSGTVFADLANDGIQQLPNDLGLGGVTLDLTGTDDLGAAVNATTTTAADGTYSFTGLRPGTYTVTEPTQPAGTVNGITTAGSTGGTATPVATLPSVISGIPLLTSGALSTGNNFAEIPNNSGVGGRVWLDLDNDGVIDTGETGIAGVTVTLTGTDTIGRPVERTLSTDAQGDYLFEQLAPGSYSVTEPTQPAGTLNGRTVVGTGGGSATPVATLPSAISGITLGIGQMVTANNFGEIPPARLAGRVYADNNDNGVIDDGETGLTGVAVVLTGTDDLGAAVTANATTGADGSYSFTDLRPGTYTVTEPTQPAGTVNGITTAGSLGGTATPVTTVPSAISGIALPVGGAGIGYNFGELSLSPDLRVAKTHAETIFTVTKPATYSIRVRNAGNAPTSGAYTVEDRLPAGLTLTATPTGTGWTCTGTAGASAFSCTSSTVIAAGATNANAITAVAVVGAAALNASPVNNAVIVEGGGEIPARRPSTAERNAFNSNPGSLPECSTDIAHNACRDPEDVQQAASLSGTVWYDIGTVQRQLDARDQPKQGWIVEVIDVTGVDPSRPNAVTGERESLTGGDAAASASAQPNAGGTPGAVVARGFTKADGTYLIENLIPNIPYGVRFRDPNSNVVFGYPVNGERGPGSSGANCLDLNKPANVESSCVETGATPQLSIRLAPGRNLVQQSLPIDPSGVVYDSGLRTPIPGAVVTLTPVGSCPAWDPADDIVGATLGGYTIAGNAISMRTGGDGLYQFLLSPGAPARCTFALTVTPPTGYTFVSKLIAPTPGPLAPSGGPGSYFNVQPQAEAPTGPVGTATTYYLSLVSGSAAPNILRNHIPLDPALPGTVLLDKTGDRSVAEIGDSVRYSITVSVPSGALPRQTTIVDRLPAGFTYIAGTATVDDKPIADPQGGVGPTLAFNLGPMGASRQLVLRYRVRVGVGAQEGDGVNRAQGQACGVPSGCVDAGFNPLPGNVATNEDRYRVRVTGGVFGAEACVVGKVFVDCNNNHVQDPEEIGIPGVRMVMSDGTTLISDSEGKYSVCGLEPKSTVMRVDPRTLPRGARMTTSSNRNLGDAGSLWLDLKNGELHRADFIEGSCSAPVIDQVKGRRAQGEIRAPETERKDGPALRFESEGPVIGPVRPRQGERVTPVDAEQKGGVHGTP